MHPEPPPNVLIKDQVSTKLRNQVIYVISGHLNNCPSFINTWGLYCNSIDYYNFYNGNNPEEIHNHKTMYNMLKQLDSSDFLDFLDVICDTLLSDPAFNNNIGKEFVKDINDVLKTNSMGYAVVGTNVVPITDLGEVEEIIIPSYHTLANAGLENVSKYLDDAYDHFKNCKNQDAILSAFKALESTVESLLINLSVDYSQHQSFASRVELLIQSLSIRGYRVDNINKLVALIKISGEIRNRYTGHGSADMDVVSDDLVKYEIDLVASTILFLTRSYLASKRI